MNQDEIMNLLNAYKDITNYKSSNGKIYVTVFDSGALDETAFALDEMQERLYQTANKVEPSSSTRYYFDGVTVTVEWGGNNI